jgi:hypothetical protein
MEQEQKPSMGRVVIYNHPGSADGKYPPAKSPAIVQKVTADDSDGNIGMSVDLFVMSNTGGIFFPKNVPFQSGDEGSSWNWPPRV